MLATKQTALVNLVHCFAPVQISFLTTRLSTVLHASCGSPRASDVSVPFWCPFLDKEGISRARGRMLGDGPFCNEKVVDVGRQMSV